MRTMEKVLAVVAVFLGSGLFGAVCCGWTPPYWLVSAVAFLALMIAGSTRAIVLKSKWYEQQYREDFRKVFGPEIANT